jgi:hypothetical protein
MSPYLESEGVDPETTYTESAPVTVTWRSHVPPLKPALAESGVARATYAPTQDAPYGTTKNDWAGKHQNETVSQLVSPLAPAADE